MMEYDPYCVAEGLMDSDEEIAEQRSGRKQSSNNTFIQPAAGKSRHGSIRLELSSP